MGKKLYVGGLSYNSTEEGLHDLFSRSGEVESVNIIIDRATGRSKGFGFVEMMTDEGAQAAINAYNGREFDGRKITVNEARPQEPREKRGFGGGGGGGGGGGRGGFGGGGGNRW